MSDERFNPDSDPLVSRTFRELETVSSPAHLDEAILGEARRAARPRYAKLRRWTRPVAWAATIGLSLAIVLQLNDGLVVPEPESTTPVEKSFESRSDDATDAGRASGAVERKREQFEQPSSTREIVSPDVDMLQEAEDIARMRSGEQQRPAAASPALKLGADLAEEATAPFCDDEQRATRESWLECIAELVEQGQERAATLEREAFAETYPDR